MCSTQHHFLLLRKSVVQYRECLWYQSNKVRFDLYPRVRSKQSLLRLVALSFHHTRNSCYMFEYLRGKIVSIELDADSLYNPPSIYASDEHIETLFISSFHRFFSLSSSPFVSHTIFLSHRCVYFSSAEATFVSLLLFELGVERLDEATIGKLATVPIVW